MSDLPPLVTSSFLRRSSVVANRRKRFVLQNPLRFVKTTLTQGCEECLVTNESEVPMGWTGLELSADQEDDVNVLLRAAWAIAYSDAFASYKCAVFRERSHNGMSRVYFSPGARELGAAFAAMPCRRPVGDGVKLVAGDERAWYACFEGIGFEPTVQMRLQPC
jgi:hypothetical protein